MITQEELKSKFHYDPETGVFTRLYRKGRVGTIWSTTEHSLRYLLIKIDYQEYKAHHLAWLYIYGYLPDKLDHKDGNGLHNWISNLREATPSQNSANRKYDGWSIKGNKYRVRIGFQGKRYHIGYYNTEEQAVAAYRAAHLKLFGEFSYWAREV